ncbi:hypothetical protein PIB30_037972 [Stylosanthes scabra]|uniref:Uncharacterized protein n=1 Tax=Stylosanthes scabra TaxID=79078 RepID=A0ABU6XE31_9FABA|nr:hypothetical protein [Stylosanthes scabra]
MLDSIVEFITQAASSSAFIFCFCNLIIVYILVDLKPSLSSSSVHQESSEVTPSSIGINHQKQGTNSKFLVRKDTESRAIQVSNVQRAGAEAEAEEEVETEEKLIEVDIIEIIDNDECFNKEVGKEEEEEEEEGNHDDELRKRVEEFIEKVNKGWKEELLIT